MRGSKWMFMLLCAVSASSIACGHRIPDTAPAPAGTVYSAIPPMPIGIGGTSQQSPTNPIRAQLSSFRQQIAIEQSTASGSITLGSAAIGAAGNTYTITADYGNTLTVTATAWKDDARHRLYSGYGGAPLVAAGSRADSITRSEPGMPMLIYVGVGVRVTVTMTVRSGSVNLADIRSLGASAAAGTVGGSISIESTGLVNPVIGNLMFTSRRLDSTTVDSALHVLDRIRNLESDPATGLVPHALGFNSTALPQVYVDQFRAFLIAFPPPSAIVMAVPSFH
jgi:hypothetical protein